MLTPIAGQSERWARPTTPPSSPETQVAQAASYIPHAVTGVTGSATSNAMDAALIAFASQKTKASPQASNQSSAPVPLDENPIAAFPSDAVAQLVKNLQSLGTSPTAQIANGGSATTTISPDLTADPGYLASLLHPAVPQPANPQPSAPARSQAEVRFLNSGTATPTAVGDIANTTTSSASNRLTDPLNDPLGSFMQQVAMAAYASGYASGMESANTSSMTGFSA